MIYDVRTITSVYRNYLEVRGKYYFSILFDGTPRVYYRSALDRYLILDSPENRAMLERALAEDGYIPRYNSENWGSEYHFTGEGFVAVTD